MRVIKKMSYITTNIISRLKNDYFVGVQTNPSRIGIEGLELEVKRINKLISRSEALVSDHDRKELQDLSHKITQLKETFKRAGSYKLPLYYEPQTTSGQGSACGLHALGKKNSRGIYQFHGPDGNQGPYSGVEAKKCFGKHLKEAIAKDDNRVKQHFVQVAKPFFNEKIDAHDSYLFKSKKGKELKHAWEQIQKTGRSKIRRAKKEEAIKLHQMILEPENVPILRDFLQEAKATCPEFSGKSEDEILKRFQKDPSKFISVFNQNRSKFIKRFDPKDQKKIETLSNAVQNALQELSEKENALLLSDKFINSYCEMVQSPSYYLTIEEVGMAAILFNKKVKIIGSLSDGYHQNQTVVLGEFNQFIKGEQIYIDYRSAHYSRCLV